MLLHREGQLSSSTLLASMEAAEEAFDQGRPAPPAHPQPHPHLQALLSGRMGEGAPSPTESACVHEATRERTIQQLFASLLTNPRCGGWGGAVVAPR